MIHRNYICCALLFVCLTGAGYSKHIGSPNLESGLEDRNDIVYFTDFESVDWTKDWDGFKYKQNMQLVDSKSSEHLDADFDGKALEIFVKKGQFYGISGKFKFKQRLGYEPEELYSRFYIYFAEDFGDRNGSEGYRGKGPGLDGTYDVEGWGGKPNSDGTKGWSCRGSNGANSDNDKIRMGFYSYEVKKGSYDYGKTFTFDKQVQAGKWYCVEQYIKLNTPGKNDGIAMAWLDGEKVYEKRDSV